MILNSKKLKDLRVKRKISQAELGFLIQVSQATICAWETKNKEIKYSELMQLANALQIEIKELVYEEIIDKVPTLRPKEKLDLNTNPRQNPKIELEITINNLNALVSAQINYLNRLQILLKLDSIND